MRGVAWGSMALLWSLTVCTSCTRTEAAPSADGRGLFAGACARCHGQEGGGGVSSSNDGVAPRNFRDHDFQSSRTDDQLRDAIKNGKGTAMPAFGAAFDDAQLRALVAQLRSFDPERGK